MSTLTHTLLEAILNDQPAVAKDAFAAAMRSKITDVLEVRKVEMAHGILMREDAAYRGYVIRCAGGTCWIEKNGEVVADAADEADAKATIDSFWADSLAESPYSQLGIGTQVHFDSETWEVTDISGDDVTIMNIESGEVITVDENEVTMTDTYRKGKFGAA